MIRLLVLSLLTNSFKPNYSTVSATTTMAIRAVDFEVFGRVQGVFFRKYTKEQAEKLDLRGWCKNTSQGTVSGHIQGPPEKIETMVNWLRNVGSPSSSIDEAVFRNQKEIDEYTFDNFSIRKD